MKREPRIPPTQRRLLVSDLPTAPCVPAIRRAVQRWRENGYDGTTATTRILLNHWFRRDHISPYGVRFAYHSAQRDAVETLVYLTEVANVRSQKQLIEKFATSVDQLYLLRYDDFPRFCFKMATGTGKTKVISLVVAWEYFNAVVERRPEFAQVSLLIAPNVIVFERLRSDFQGGRIFRNDPVVPPDLEDDWDFECYVRGESERGQSSGALYLTNIQQLYDRPETELNPCLNPVGALLGSSPPSELIERIGFVNRLIRRQRPILIINDEAHHTHDEESEWSQVIRGIHKKTTPGVAAEFDFSATPRFSKGGLFSWTVFDYPLKAAIADGIVKRPVKGITKDIAEARSSIASRRYAAYLAAGVERWKEYRRQLAPLGKKPVLFVMMGDTQAADEVGAYLRERHPADFGGGKLQVIHTDNSGEVSSSMLDQARNIVRTIDEPENKTTAIVSVLMLREGWDVQNVTVVVGLRPFSSKAKILPEQSIGRGLRLMFRDQGIRESFVERVDIIGNAAFIKFVDELDQAEGLALDSYRVGIEKLTIVTIAPHPERSELDITIPILTPMLVRKKELTSEIESLDVKAMSFPPMPIKSTDQLARTFRYEGYDLLTLEKVVARTYSIPDAQTPQEVVSYYAKRIAEELKLPSQFAALVPKVKEFLETRLFGKLVDLSDKDVLRAIGSNAAHYVTVREFVHRLRPLLIEQRIPTLETQGKRLSEGRPFPYSRLTYDSTKSVYKLVPCANTFERDFAHFLDSAEDVKAFAKIPESFGFSIEYADSVANLRHYFPDFVVVTNDEKHYLVETKGMEDVDVPHKDSAARLWCTNATTLTSITWNYIKVLQKEWTKLEAERFEEILVWQS
ncbi:MAG: DEAD/DEAH box helicase family protein [Thermoplasmata archaeon]|nr:DEAD/DEAH box helicase family protein [Thermoplasmata archaeon]